MDQQRIQKLWAWEQAALPVLLPCHMLGWAVTAVRGPVWNQRGLWGWKMWAWRAGMEPQARGQAELRVPWCWQHGRQEQALSFLDSWSSLQVNEPGLGGDKLGHRPTCSRSRPGLGHPPKWSCWAMGGGAGPGEGDRAVRPLGAPTSIRREAVKSQFIVCNVCRLIY